MTAKLFTPQRSGSDEVYGAQLAFAPAMTALAYVPDPLAVAEGGTGATIATPTLAVGASVDSTVYVSGNEAVATVDSAGVVTGVSTGATTITCTVTASGSGLSTTTLDAAITVNVGVAPPIPLPVNALALTVVVAQLTIGSTTHYFSDIEYGDNYTRWHDARIVGDIAYSRSVDCVLWGSRNRRNGGLGNIELINVDGALDGLITGSQAAATVAVFEVDQDQPMSAATQIASAVVTAIEGRGEQTLRIITGDILALLDVPLQASLYASGDGVATLIGRPRPVAIGKPLSCPIVLVDEVDYEYDCHDSDAFEIDKVRDSGYPLALGTDPGDGYKIATTTGIHGIELLQVPIGRVVADVDTAASGVVEVIINATDGDFASTIAAWTPATDVGGGGTATAAWDASARAKLVADRRAETSGAGAFAEIEYPTALVAGQRYDYTLDLDLTTAGTAGYAGLQVMFRPTSLAPVDYITLGLVYLTGTSTLAGQFTAPVAGHFVIRAACAFGASAVAYIDAVRLDRISAGGNVADIITQLLARAGIGAGQIDADSLDALATDRPWPCSYWADSATQISDVIQQLLDSVYGWVFTDRLGRISVGYLQPPSVGTALLDITATELADDIEVEPDLAPGLSTTVAGARNWYRYGEGELADAISDADRALLTADYRIRRTSADPVGVELGPRAGANVSQMSESGIATLLDDATNIQAAADYLADLYPAGEPRRFYKIPVWLADGAAAINPGDKITVTYDRFGCDAGRALRVVGIDSRAGDRLAMLRCWGSAT